MKKALIGFFLGAFMVCSANPAFAARPSSFSELGYQTVQEVWNQLRYYGLWEMNPWHPSLPRPQVPALKAVVSQRAGLLAYYDEENGWGGSTLVFKNPNGGYRHSVSFNRDQIQFVTPYQGTVAHAQVYFTVNGPAYQFYCRSQVVSEPGFYSCIRRFFTQVIVDQLRRYAH